MSPYPRTLTDLPDVPTTPPVTMTIKEAAAFLGLSLSATYEAAARGEIPTMKIGRRVLVKREQLVSMVTSWWDCAARLDAVDPDRRRRFTKDAIATLQNAHPGVIETTGRNHVLFATV